MVSQNRYLLNIYVSLALSLKFNDKCWIKKNTKKGRRKLKLNKRLNVIDHKN